MLDCRLEQTPLAKPGNLLGIGMICALSQAMVEIVAGLILEKSNGGEKVGKTNDGNT
jgi:hypothetical protein